MLGFSSISTRAAGAAWLCLSLAGVLAWLGARRAAPAQPDGLEAMPADVRAARGWLWACAAAWALMAIPTAYWSGPWPERHPQWRLLIGALGVWLLLRHHKPSTRQLQAWGHAAALSSVLAYVWVVTLSSDAAPTNRIPWMAGLSLLACALLTMSYSVAGVAMQTRRWWLAASALMGVTVLLSGVRGSWPLLLVWPLALWGMHRSDRPLWQGAWRWLLPLLAALFIGGLQTTPDKDNPFLRMQNVVEETGLQEQGAAIRYDSSSGVRLGLYKIGLIHSAETSWLGVGPEGNKRLIREALIDLGAPGLIQSIGHWHSDWLNPAVEFGLLGFVGYLAFAAGLSIASRRLAMCSTGQTSAVGMAALLAMHLLTGLSNMNLAHNYYPTLLSISACLLMASMRR